MSKLLDLIGQDYTLRRKGSNYFTTEEHDSLIINVKEDLFFWNSKHINGNAYTWLTKIKGYSRSDALNLLASNNPTESIVYTVVDDFGGGQVTVYPKLVNLLWENGKNHRDYWYRRGIRDATIDRFRLGYSDGWYVIPFFVDSAFVNFQKRRDYPEKRISNWYRGIGQILFNSAILKITNTVIITESPTDAILLNQFGYPNVVSHNGGSGVDFNKFFKYFINQKEIYIVYDNDDAGRKGAFGVARALGESRCKTYTFDGHKDKYDLGDWLSENNPKDFGKLLIEESRYVFE